MTQLAADLTQTDVARLLGTLGHVTASHLIGVLGQEVQAGRQSWAQHRGGPDTFGPSLAARVRSGATLSRPQVNSARTGLLQRNWQAVRDLVTRDVVRVADSTITRARQRRPVRVATPTPQPVAATATCGNRSWGVTCTLPQGHAGAHIGENENPVNVPTADVDSVLSGGLKGTTITVTATVTHDPADSDQDAQARRFALVIEAAWDDVPAPALPEPETDASIERFRNLDLD